MIPPKATKALNALFFMIPIACFLLLTWRVFGEWRQMQELMREQLATDHQISVVDHTLSIGAGMPSYNQHPTAEQSAAEQAQFLDQLHREAKAARVQIMTWSNASVASPSAATTAGATDSRTLPAGINPIASQVDVEGGFRDLRRFLYNLERTPRLLNLGSPHWARAVWPKTHLSFTLTRYVTPEADPIEMPVGRVADGPRAPVRTSPRS